MLAESLYDWSTPDYRRLNYPLTVGSNLTALERFIDTWPIGIMPYVSAMFNLTGLTTTDNDAQLQASHDAVLAFCTAQAYVVAYALYSLPTASYDDSSSPTALYRGGGRGVEFYCNQFGDEFGVSVDECIAQHFGQGGSIKVKSFWSTTTDATVVQHYKGKVVYTILPGPKYRDHWLARSIKEFSEQPSANEWLYPNGASFDVVNATCDRSTGIPFWNVFLSERGMNEQPSQQMTFESCVDDAVEEELGDRFVD